MTRKTQLPNDFQVTDKVRQYCATKWNLLYLPDAFLEDFKEVFNENGRRHINWDTTFKTFIRRASPSGQFYNTSFWERKTEFARRYKPHGESTNIPSVRSNERLPAENVVPPKKSTWVPGSATGKESMRHIRELLK